MQRVRVGLMGLAAVFLLVLLAAALLGLANRGSDVQRPGGETAGTGPAQGSAGGDPKEPLAELGVTPGGSGDGDNEVMAAPLAGQSSRSTPVK